MACEVRNTETSAGAVQMTIAPGWISPYVGLPFVDGGRSLDGVDCEGICRLIMRDMAGDPPIPDYGMLSAHGLLAVSHAIAEGSVLSPWVPVARNALKPFDWVLMTARARVDGRPRSIVLHLGIMITESLMLHVEEATHSVVIAVDHYLIRNRLVCFVRHEALA